MDAVGTTKLVAIVDDDESMRSAIQDLLEAVDLRAHGFVSAEEFLKSGKQRNTACLIADIRMPQSA
jgi:FixJ family two-component response regulator